MIAYIEGKIIEKKDTFVILNVSGIGYKINTTQETSAKIKNTDKTSLWIYHAIRENSQDLYGFENKIDLEMFEMLLTISGIGPKSALSILNIAPTETIIDGIKSEDPNYLSKISGISKKNSEKIILNLKNKISEYQNDQSEESKNNNSTAIDALVALGYSEKESRIVVQDIYKKEKMSDNSQNTEKIIKLALKKLSGQ
ncbi:MAG TPA: Holliday junction branch migration protein RuvA [Candidatus Paceibacterota bacterium]|nr:Holliday junction branch migration protein RuvA [Candidatus Paceibacterota bacterium]HMP18970.1 Holliday junction branch migration protein RuvA [Candidatus Paceibacterota bacterium]HMP85483.1 Holliday junction branch migration protein RuvA [Candidatus Paceibacterota bacterium]